MKSNDFFHFPITQRHIWLSRQKYNPTLFRCNTNRSTLHFTGFSRSNKTPALLFRPNHIHLSRNLSYADASVAYISPAINPFSRNTVGDNIRPAAEPVVDFLAKVDFVNGLRMSNCVSQLKRPPSAALSSNPEIFRKEEVDVYIEYRFVSLVYFILAENAVTLRAAFSLGRFMVSETSASV